jgi:hypothetical protein
MRASSINARILGPIGIALRAMTSPQRMFALYLIQPPIIADATFFRKGRCSPLVRFHLQPLSAACLTQSFAVAFDW